MKIFYDTEFIEDGRTVEMISIGMVAEDGRELYAVSEEIRSGELHQRICNQPWLMRHVVPGLPLDSDKKGIGWSSSSGDYFALDLSSNLIMPRRMIRNLAREFILATPSPELWAWYGAYDHVALMQLFGRMVDRPNGIPMWTNDLKQLCVQLGNPTLPTQKEGQHNALEDAKWNREAYNFLQTVVDEKAQQSDTKIHSMTG